MPGPQDLLANSLARVAKLHSAGQYVVGTGDLPNADRSRLLKAGWLAPIVRGWYLSSRPDINDGETTTWHANWKEFVARYARKRFGDQWHLSPKISLLVQTALPVVSRQVIIYTRVGHNNVTPLIHGWSVIDYKTRALAPNTDIVEQTGLRVLSIPYALTEVSENFFRSQKASAEIALSLLPDVSDLARILLDAGKPVVGGRLVGALRAAGRAREANELKEILQAGGYHLIETDPFETPPIVVAPAIKRSPYVIRIHTMWASMQKTAIGAFDAPPGAPASTSAYLADVDARYLNDAYNSLSIEGYSVTPELIEHVRTGRWNPDGEDKKSRDAMAAKGYSIAHDAVKESIQKILNGANAGSVLRDSLAGWNRALWTPSVQAGIVKPSELAGYRNGPVYIKNAQHVPPPREAVRDCMPEFFDLLEKEYHPAARSVLGHFMFVFIHPYVDGNGRLGRFIMNAMLASGGYPWTVIPVERRDDYLRALDQASAHGNIEPFAKFLGGLVREQTTQIPARTREKAA
jgi:Fic family protein